MTETRVHLPRRPAPHAGTGWHDRAACRDSDPELFFPVGKAGPALVQIARAKQVCARCPVCAPCLAWALETGQEAGVWGGTSEDERRALRQRRLRETSAGPCAAGSRTSPPPSRAGEESGRV
jgi:WhiB family transcriptional regulator, redox-sensing transcriptional regulator